MNAWYITCEGLIASNEFIIKTVCFVIQERPQPIKSLSLSRPRVAPDLTLRLPRSSHQIQTTPTWLVVIQLSSIQLKS